MKVETGSTFVNSTGNKIPTLSDPTLVVDMVIFFVGTAVAEVSAGFSDLTNKFNANKYGDSNLTKTFRHYRTISGTKTKTLELDLTAVSTGDFTFNVSTLTQNTTVNWVVLGH